MLKNSAERVFVIRFYMNLTIVYETWTVITLKPSAPSHVKNENQNQKFRAQDRSPSSGKRLR